MKREDAMKTLRFLVVVWLLHTIPVWILAEESCFGGSSASSERAEGTQHWAPHLPHRVTSIRAGAVISWLLAGVPWAKQSSDWGRLLCCSSGNERSLFLPFQI